MSPTTCVGATGLVAVPGPIWSLRIRRSLTVLLLAAVVAAGALTAYALPSTAAAATATSATTTGMNTSAADSTTTTDTSTPGKQSRGSQWLNVVVLLGLLMFVGGLYNNDIRRSSK